jgi:hypothetical protein
MLTLFLFAASVVLKVEKVDPASKKFTVGPVLPVHFEMEQLGPEVPQVGEFLQCTLIHLPVLDAEGKPIPSQQHNVFDCKRVKADLKHVIFDVK